MQAKDLARKLQINTLKSLSPALIIELCEKESREMITLNPQYSVLYLRKKFEKKHNAR